MEKNQFSQKEQEILSIVQEQLPHSLTPFADIAKELGLEEAKVIDLLQKLVDDGTIRRFGASIKHQKTVWQYNSMVAWNCPLDLLDELGELAKKDSHISHCYFRPVPSDVTDWPYNFFTMVHARSQEESQNIILALSQNFKIQDYAILESIKEYKKSSMRYF